MKKTYLIASFLVLGAGAISASAGMVDDLIAEIASASQEQTQGIGQINGGISSLNGVVQANANGAQEIATAGQELTTQASGLEQMVAEYTLGKGRELQGKVAA